LLLGGASVWFVRSWREAAPFASSVDSAGSPAVLDLAFTEGPVDPDNIFLRHDDRHEPRESADSSEPTTWVDDHWQYTLHGDGTIEKRPLTFVAGLRAWFGAD
jgi:hypothetical protein